MRELLRYALVTAIACSVAINAQHGDSENKTTALGSGTAGPTTRSTASQSIALGASTYGNGTCASRTANYITHTLPQQCLRTDRIHANTTQSLGPNQTFATDTSSSEAGRSGSTNEPLESSIVVNDQPATHLSTPTAPDSSGGSIATETTLPAQGTASGSSDSIILSAHGIETDSPLDNANFLSFEEWKKQAMAKYADQGGNLRERTERQRPGINNALEGFGEEGEIELDFSGFGAADQPLQKPAPSISGGDAAQAQNAPTSQSARSKDAGKTCKERTNYASFDCAATVLKNNPECKSASSILVENKDSYMLNTCSAQNKFFIVELCDLILVDTVVLANYEFFSSIFRHFRVSVSGTYPVKMEKWVDLGTYEAKNTREVQAFLIEHSRIWARYLRIEFLTHYGSEYYCPVSLMRIHGTTMLEEFRVGDGVEEATKEVESVVVSSIIEEPSKVTVESLKDTLLAESKESESSGTEATASATSSASESSSANATSTSEGASASPQPLTSGTTSPASKSNAEAAINSNDEDSDSYGTDSGSSTTMLNPPSDFPAGSRSDLVTRSSKKDPSTNLKHNTAAQANADTELTTSQNVTSTTAKSETSSTKQTTDLNAAESIPALEPVSSNFTISSPASSATDHGASSSDSNATSRPAASSSTALAQPQPSTQESFFKSIHKRLQQLESNSTLSLQYIEEQSRILRDAFTKVEKRQITATSSFLTNLNDTVMNELRGFRQAYDQLWQSTVIELEGQREQYQREMLALSSRLTLVADELVWQKRMGIVQSTLLMLCLGLVIFARGGQTGYLEVPLMQQVMNRSTAAIAGGGWESPPASPSPESRSPVRLFRRKLWRSVTEPSVGNVTDGVTDGTDSRPESKDGPLVHVEPPSPTSRDGLGLEWEDADDEEEIVTPRESQSGPATPSGTRGREGVGEGILDAG